MGATGPAGIVPIYGPQGLRATPKMWAGPVISANGLWSASIASAGCTVTPWNVQVQALGGDSTAAGVRVANVSAVSPTTVSGTVTQPATVSLLGVLSLSLATTGSPTVWVEAHCN